MKELIGYHALLVPRWRVRISYHLSLQQHQGVSGLAISDS